MLEAVFFHTDAGSEPVRDWLRALPKEERRIIGNDIDLVQQGWPMGKPLVDSLGHGLWEVRSRLDDRIARVIFYMKGSNMVLLHGFIKKTQKTPLPELKLALNRKKLWESKE